jgi:hypothetical protein
MRESLNIMEQCLNFLANLNNINDFNYLVDDFKIVHLLVVLLNIQWNH